MILSTKGVKFTKADLRFADCFRIDQMVKKAVNASKQRTSTAR